MVDLQLNIHLNLMKIFRLVFLLEIGIKDLGYKGNIPNIWDGVPQDVLDQYGLEYDKDWVEKFVDQSKRNITAEWDDEGNLLT
mgnify:CR=1 FL=1